MISESRKQTAESFIRMAKRFLQQYSVCRLETRYTAFQYRPTSGLMQILHFDWLRYQGTFSPNKYFFNLHLLTLLLPFLSYQLGDAKTIRPFALMGHGSKAHEAKPNGLLTRSPFGLRRYSALGRYSKKRKSGSAENDCQ